MHLLTVANAQITEQINKIFEVIRVVVWQYEIINFIWKFKDCCSIPEETYKPYLGLKEII